MYRRIDMEVMGQADKIILLKESDIYLWNMNNKRSIPKYYIYFIFGKKGQQVGMIYETKQDSRLQSQTVNKDDND